jgi:hypothetical protein
MVTVKEKEKVDLQEMMKVMKEMGTPGAQHKLLAKLAGNWKTSVKSWMEPGKPPEESSGKSEQKIIMGGRYLQQNETGEMMGTPFSGMGITGYDNNSKKYFSYWLDSMSTGAYYFEGNASADGKSITMENHYNDPFRGPVAYHSVIRFISDNSYTFEMFRIDKNGKEEKVMESTYTREK